MAASHQPKQFKKEDTNVTELEQAQAAQKQAETERDAAIQELKQFKSQKRTGDIAALQTELNVTFSAEDQNAYAEMDDAVFSVVTSQLRQFSSKQPPGGQQQGKGANPAFAHLFSHQANNGQNGDQPGHNGNHKFTSGAQAFAEQNKGK